MSVIFAVRTAPIPGRMGYRDGLSFLGRFAPDPQQDFS
jgi:hypothetical protein